MKAPMKVAIIHSGVFRIIGLVSSLSSFIFLPPSPFPFLSFYPLPYVCEFWSITHEKRFACVQFSCILVVDYCSKILFLNS